MAVHGLAANYHWDEEQIFALPFVRFRAYQDALLREQGKTIEEDEPESDEMDALQAAMIAIMSVKHNE